MTRLFDMPGKMVKVFDQDLRLAGIRKRDERGRTADVHCLRTTFATMLAKAGVPPRTAMAAMRHSDIRLTMGTFTDPKLLDVAGAVESLPSLPLTGGPESCRIDVKATGTDDFRAFQLAPMLAPTPDKSSKSGSFPGKTGLASDSGLDPWSVAVSGYPVNENDLLTTAVNRSLEVERKAAIPGLSVFLGH